MTLGFRTKKAPETSTRFSTREANPPPARSTTALIREELAEATAACERLFERSNAAQLELNNAQQAFDADLMASALGERQAEPDRARVVAAIATCDALRRILAAAREKVGPLREQLASAELAEASEKGDERLTVLVNLADIRVEQFEQAVAAAKQAEKLLFQVLYNRDVTGLKLPLATPEQQRQAAAARGRIARRAMAVREMFGYAPNPSFEIDGGEFLGEEYQTVFRPWK